MTEPKSESPFEIQRREIMEDHRQLGDLLTQLHQAPHLSDTSRLLGDLQGLLRRHFAREESPDGLFEMIGSRAPHHRETVQALASEHVTFLTELDELAATPEGRAVEAISDRVIRFVTRLREHESRESKLLLDSLSP